MRQPLPEPITDPPLAKSLVALDHRIRAAAQRAGRRPDTVELVAVSKRHPATAVVEAIRAGVRCFGENYVQEALAKQAQVRTLLGADAEGIAWHLIGALQTNKARQCVGAFAVLESVDRIALARELDRRAQALGRRQAVLVEVNLSGEPGRAGVALEATEALCAQVAALDGLELLGLMGMAPVAGDARTHFAALRMQFEALPADHRRVLSMGMSADFEAAIEEGATEVRIGTALFGARNLGIDG